MDKSDSISFERNLGNPEMLMGHRWRERSSEDCQICSKLTFTVIVWNKKLSERTVKNEAKQGKDKEFLAKFYKYEPKDMLLPTNSSYDHPIALFGGKVHKMVSLKEFMERLLTKNQSNVRNCDNEVEAARF